VILTRIEKQASYRQILKSTSIFGGVQFINIAVSLVRSKFLAVLLGPSGVGLIGLYSSATQIVTGFIDLGMSVSGVKSVSEAATGGDDFEIRKTVTVVRKIAWLSGTLGAIVTFLFSNYLSVITFGNEDFSIAFKWLSITVLFTQLSNSYLVVLQGFRRLALLAKAGVLGNILGVSVSLPMYYLLGKDGIVLSLLASSGLSLLIAWYYGRKERVIPIHLTTDEFLSKTKFILMMGIALSVSSILVLLSAYFLKIYIGSRGGISDVGLYNAGYAIVNTYVGMVFTAMGTDFYPRLSGTKEAGLFNQLVNHQAELAVLIVGPLAIGMIVFEEYLVVLLFSSEFLQVVEMMKWSLVGVFFKAVSWPLGFIILAKGNSKLFFVSELLANTYMFLLSLVGYYFWGLEGIGIAYLGGYLLVTIQIMFISKTFYEFTYSLSMAKISIVVLLLLVLIILVSKLFAGKIALILGMIVLMGSIYFSIAMINRRLPIIKTLRNRFFN
jgi:O-antigen/teichoic acid export membrane protein